MNRIAVNLVILLSLSLTPAYSATPPKAGSLCLKQGITKTFQSRKYTCIKSGKKLVWSKGVVVKRATATPTPAITSEPISLSSEPPKNESQINIQVGDSCSVLGQVIQIDTKILMCRYVKNQELRYLLDNYSDQTISNSLSPDKLELCKIKDARLVKLNGGSIAYPVERSSVISKGRINWALVPIDFIDAPGTGDPYLDYYKEMKAVDEWLAWYTNKTLEINWILNNEWIRAPLVSREYNWVHPGKSGYTRFPYTGDQSGISNFSILVSELARIGEKNFNYQNLDVVLYVYPSNIRDIVDPISAAGEVRTDKVRSKGIFNLSVGAWLFDRRNPQVKWSFWIHELGHGWGLTGHYPVNPMRYSIMAHQWALGLGLSSWDSLILDWIKQDQVYCIDKQNISSQKITLVPLEREQNGVRSVMIRMNATKVLVVESHRPDKWSLGMSSESFGILTYLVDTTQDTDRRDENKQFDAKLPKTAWYLPVDKDFIRTIQAGTNLSTTLFLDESITVEGIRISLVESGYNDTVKLEKVESK